MTAHPSHPDSDWPADIAAGPDLPRVLVRPVQLHAAADLIEHITAGKQPADRALQQHFRQNHRLGKRDRRLIQELVYFTLRHWRLLNWLLGDNAAPPVQQVAAALALGARLDEVLADASALSETQRTSLAVRRDTPWLHIDAAIRLGLRDADLVRLQHIPGGNPEALMAAMNQRAPTDIRINPQRTTVRSVQDELAAAGVGSEPIVGLPLGLRIPDQAALTRLSSFQAGGFEIQDAGSQWIVAACMAAPGEHLLDLCAGAGGKTLALASTLQGSGHLLACDTAPHRLERLQPRLGRAGLQDAVDALVIDGSDDPVLQARGPFDGILIDAPCSGSGTWRRHPELKQTDVPFDQLLTTQQRLLRDAVDLLRPGGHIVYATCSLWREENEQQIERFLAEHPGWRLVASPAPSSCSGDTLMVRLRPDRDRTDGFFYARLQSPA